MRWLKRMHSKWTPLSIYGWLNNFLWGRCLKCGSPEVHFRWSQEGNGYVCYACGNKEQANEP
jgi:hypothetical protein